MAMSIAISMTSLPQPGNHQNFIWMLTDLNACPFIGLAIMGYLITVTVSLIANFISLWPSSN